MDFLTDMSLIERLISTMGFPIALVAYLLWDRARSQIRHEKILDKFNASIEANTRATNELLRRSENIK